MAHQWLVGLLAWHTFFGLTTAQVPSVWKPYDVVTYYCSRWYHQGKDLLPILKMKPTLTCAAIVKNDVLYLYGGIQTFNVPNLTVKSTNNSLGYSKYRISQSLYMKQLYY